ncbi:MAG: hypothetical protein WDN76_10955 [Alphaproteobacteria bacterium]
MASSATANHWYADAVYTGAIVNGANTTTLGTPEFDEQTGGWRASRSTRSIRQTTTSTSASTSRPFWIPPTPPLA